MLCKQFGGKMLKLEHINKTINRNKILVDVNYTFNKGQLYPILGPLNSGKTTLIKCIAGDLSINSGEIKTKAKSTIFEAAKQSVLPMFITGYDFIKMLCDMAAGHNKVEEYLKLVNLPQSAWNITISDYSFEDKKRIQLAAFLIQKPYVILFDEPMDYCSEEYIEDFLRIVNIMKEEHIIIITTGLFEIAEKISSDIVIMNNGELNLLSRDTLQVPEIRQAVEDLVGEAEDEII